MSEYRELLLGCGNRRVKHIRLAEAAGAEWRNLTTLDFDPNCLPDVEWDLTRRLPLPFDDNTFDEIHAYEVLEHLGQQGDFVRFFEQFSDYWRILKPGGSLVGTVPQWNTETAFLDPGHTRVITPRMFGFLSQRIYTDEVGVTAITDYRRWYQADFESVFIQTQGDNLGFVLRAVKPSRISRG